MLGPWIKANWKGEKLDKRVTHELTRNQKSHRFEMLSSLILCNNNEPFLDQTVTCNEKWILYDSWQRPACIWTFKALHKARLAPGKVWSLFGGLLLVWSTTAFWILAEPLHLRSMLSKLMRCTENCNTCRRYWSTERAQFSTTTAEHILDNQCFKSWTNWAVKFSPITIFTWPLANWLPLL